MSEKILIKDVEEKIAATKSGGFSRHNGGWMKTVTGINKAQTNGYSIEGKFFSSPEHFNSGDLILDCSIFGSKRNPEKRYNLFKVLKNGDLELVEKSFDKKTWAVDLWESIEKNIQTKKSKFEGFSDEELIEEMKKRKLM